MSITRIKVLITLILFSSPHFNALAQESNLKTFFIKGDNDLAYLGYVEINGLYGYINRKGEILIKPKFEKASHFE